MRRAALRLSLTFLVVTSALVRPAFAQTTLTPGDLAIVGVNANNSCITATADEISFICFKNITTNTQIDLTDNGFERQLAGLWGEGEGFNRLIRTGPMIPAGTVITIRINGLVLPTVVAPDAAWTVLAPFGQSVNMNSNGDQLFFTQGGTWTNPAGTNNTSFTGTVLYAFNTKTAWVPFTNSTQDSGLPPGSLCFSMNPTAATDFVKYTDASFGGAFATRTQRAWLIDIDNSANWSTYASCAAYNSGTPNYVGGFAFPITGGTFSNGLWTGAKSQDWFDCRNWDDAEVPNAASNVVINQTKIQDCVVGINGSTPLTAQCATLAVSSSTTAQPLLTIDNGRQLVVSGGASVIRSGAVTNIGITVTNGSFTAGALTLLGSAAAAQNAVFRNNVATNTVQINGDVLISTGGQLNLITGSMNLTGNFRSMDALAGSTPFFELNSVVQFNGAGPQSIITSGHEEFFGTLRVNKSASDLTLSAPITVNVNLDLQQGRVFSTNANLLTVGLLGSATNASNNSFVSGPVMKEGSTAFTFPIGKNTTHRPASITPVAGLGNDAFRAEYFPATTPNTPSVLFGPALAPTLDHISDCEYWQIDRTFGSTSAFVTLSWDAATSCGVTLPADLRVARWNGTLWEDRGNGGTTGGLLAGTVITAAAQPNFSPWTLASVSAQNPLPIELMYFLARPQGDVVQLDWATASERDNAFFTVERSADGMRFEPVLTRDGAGNSATTLHYTDADPRPLPGTSYYRLRQTDHDGTSTLSEVVPVTFTTATDGLTILYGEQGPVAVHGFPTGSRYTVLDLMGRTVSDGVVTQEGRLELPVNGLAAGTYVLRLTDGRQVRSAQFVR
jgi:hypothetical protein